MANFTWEFDAPSGTYKNHSLSDELRFASYEQTIFPQYARIESSFGKKMGETYNIVRVPAGSEPTNAEISENENIPEDLFSLSTIAATVKALGRSFRFSEIAELLSKYDLENPMQRQLRDVLALILDTKAAAAFKTAKVKYTPTGLASGTFVTDGTVASQATVPWNVYHAERARDFLFDTLHRPFFDERGYIGIFRTKSIRGVYNDPQFDEWNKYTTPEKKERTEIGKIADIVHLETNHANALANQGASSVLGEGVVFGQDPVALVEALSPELRAGLPTNLGLQKLIGWVAILVYSIIWDTGNAGQASIIHVTST